MKVPSLHTRTLFYLGSLGSVGGLGALSWLWPMAVWGFVIVAPVVLIGCYDVLQTRRSILRNYPVIGHVRYLFEAIRPEIQQYFIEQNLEGRPLNREERSVVYARAKRQLATLPFGTRLDVYAVGYQWMNHSLAPKPYRDAGRVLIGGSDCKKPYRSSLLNISAMSFGSLSKNAILALSRGAKAGDFFHNTGEGSISAYHIEGGADLCWQIGTGYFGCRNQDGTFNEEMFAKSAQRSQVKLIEIKLSQGAKPGKGGILPAAKITEEISEIRQVPRGKDVISPSAHSAFDSPTGLLRFVKKLRDLSGGKPVGFKLCVGRRREFFAICKAMIDTNIRPDFITVDGAEGGTGAAPLEFSNSVGTPLVEGLVTVQNGLVGFGLRDDVRIIASGRVMTGFGMAKRLALGADICNAARAFMLSVGCIQALRCHHNDCPAGVATQNAGLMAGLVVDDKAKRVCEFQSETLHSLQELVAASGLDDASALRPWHILRRISASETRHYGEVFRYLEKGELLRDELPDDYRRAVQAASADTFAHARPHA